MKNKNILALAITGMLIAPLTAQAANVEVYGKVRMSANMADNGAAAPAESSTLSVSSNSSRIGFKGSEDLGNGLTALYQAETDYSFDDANTFSARDGYVGIQGGFGKLRAGRLSSPYKMTTASLDVWNDSPGDYNTIIRHDTRASNSIEYSSKTKDGLSFAAAYIASTVDDELPVTAGNADRDGISLSATFTQDKIKGTLAIENLGQGTGQPDDKGTKIGVSYQLDNITLLNGIYEMVDDGTVDNSTIYISGTRKMNNKYLLKGAFGSRDSTSGASDGATFLAIGVSHQYTKNVEVYALYAQVDNDAGSQLGLQKAMDGAGVANETASSVSIGINMNFSSM